MNTERLTAEDMLNKHDDRIMVFYKKVLSAMESYAAQEAEHKTKQLREEIAIVRLLLQRMVDAWDYGLAIHSLSKLHVDTAELLYQLNRKNEK